MNRTTRFSTLRKLLGPAVVASVLLLSPVSAHAQEEDKLYDGRVEGYASKMAVDGGSAGLMWMLTIVMGAVTVGVLFKNARRTHLD